MTLIDDDGFHRTRLDERLATLEADVRAIYGDDIDLTPESPDGQLLGVFAEAISDVDQLAEDVYNGRSPAGARGAGLARLVRLNGVTKKEEQFSTAPLNVVGVDGTIIPAGSLVASTVDATAVFATIADISIAGGIGSGTVRATVAGPIEAAPGTITAIKTVISGWTSATNPSAATPGALGESDPALRVRREASVAAPSQGMLDGLYADLAQLPDVRNVVVFENPEDTILTPITTNGGGSLPPHSIQAIVDGGASDAIAAALWRRKSLGVTQVGAISGTVTDTQGFPHTMRWDAPVDVSVYVTVRVNATSISPALATAIKDALVAYGTETARIGKDVIWSRLFIPINAASTLDIDAVYLGDAPNPSLQQNLAVAYNAIPRWAASRIQVLPAV